jgi:hypothetical protein
MADMTRMDPAPGQNPISGFSGGARNTLPGLARQARV